MKTTTKNTTLEFSTPTHAEIAAQAEKLWHAADCPQGRSSEFWFEAERSLFASYKEKVETRSKIEPVTYSEAQSFSQSAKTDKALGKKRRRQIL